jgi:flagella basal body P-ring formation protein FlgA
MWRIIFSIALPLLTVVSACAEEAAVVHIALRQRSTVGQRLVKTNHIADIQGGQASVRRRISELDVLEFPAGRTREQINQSQLSLRLQLAGVPESAFRISGPTRSTITLGTTIASSDQRIIAAARKALSRHWQVAPDDLQIRLSQPLPAALRTLLAEDADLEISPFLNGDQTPGFMRLVLGVYRYHNLVNKVTVLLDVQLFRTVAVTNGPLSARQLITADDFRLERRSVSGRVAMDAVTEVANKVATRAVRAGVILVNKDIRPHGSGSAERAEVIKRGDLVRLVARTRGLSVTLRACEALENGRVNETIRVRNLQSKTIVTGRVLNASELEVSF